MPSIWDNAGAPAPTVTFAQWKGDFPEFDTDDSSLAALFPESAFNYWAQVGMFLINQNRWGRLFNVGLELFVAHHIVLEALAQRDMNVGGLPGLAKGAIAGKAAGAVTVTYDPRSTLTEDGEHWNYTVYGQRYINMAKMMGAGPIQVGPGCF